MIWDHWDDAMDDLRDDRAYYNKEIARLEKRLAELGVDIPPWRPVRERDSKDHNEMYWNELFDTDLLRGRLSELKTLLDAKLKK